MAYERVQKLFGQSSLKKKHTPIVPPLTKQQTQDDSQLSPKVNLSRIPSSEEKETIKRKIFDTICRSAENQAMHESLYSATAPVQKALDVSSIAGTPVQAKLTISAPGDKYEQEADRVADLVVNQINAPVAQQSAQNLQDLPDELTHVVQQNGRAVMRSPLPQQQSPLIQRKAITAQDLGCNDDNTGAIFDSRLKTGKKFSLETQTEDSGWKDAISAYTQAIRPVGNVVGNIGYTDKKLTFFKNLPSDKKWGGQKKSSFVKTAKDELKIPDKILENNPPHGYWKDLSEKADKNRENLCNNDDIGLIDPFLVNVVVKNNTNKNWEFLTQFADSGTGYIIKIVNGTQEIEGNIATRDDFKAKKDEEVGDKTGYLYSSTHDQGSQPFGDQIDSIEKSDPGKDKKGSQATGLDAITWLAAEGARFKPIEKLGVSGSPESCFFIQPNEENGTGFKYLTTADLMQCWGKKFNRKYGIETSEVADIVRQDGKTDKTEPPAGSHYNLTKDKIYKQD